MTTEKIRVSSLGSCMGDALAATEALGAEKGLDKKQTIHLRLLAEELFGMLRGIAGNVEADYWLDQDGPAYTLHLASDLTMNKEMRELLISVSSSGKNAAAKGFMGKLREMIAVALLPKDASAPPVPGFSQGLMTMAGNSSPYAQQASADAFRWSMQQYKNELDSKRAENGEAEAAWDELEKSIVASIADEVRVYAVGSSIEISIFKTF